MLKTIHAYFKNSLRRNLQLKTFLALFATLLLTTVATMTYLIPYVLRQEVKQTSSLMSLGFDNIEHYIDVICDASLLPYTDSTLYSAIAAPRNTVSADMEVETCMQIAMSSILANEPSVYQVHMYAQKSPLQYVARRTGKEKSRRAADGARRSRDFYISGLHESEEYLGFIIQAEQPIPVVTIHRNIYTVPEGEYVGEINIDIDTSYFQTQFNKLIGEEGSEIFLLNGANELVCCSDIAAWKDKEITNWIGVLPKSKGAYTCYRSEEEKLTLLFSQSHPVAGETWTLVKTMPVQQLIPMVFSVISVNFFNVLLFFLVALFMLRIVILRFTEPISVLIRHMDSIRTGEMERQLINERTDEIGLLFDHFQSMMNSINDLILKNYKLELANKAKQIRILQAQLNPHFINNTIQSIGTMALHAGEKDIYDLLSCFGGMMHYCMKISEDVVSLQDEINYVQAYIRLQKKRVGYKLCYSILLPQQLCTISMPKMLLQPLVENCFVHGFSAFAGEMAAICMHVKEQDGMVEIAIEDNGCGMGEEELEKLRGLIREESVLPREEDSNIGVKNIAAMLGMFYGEAAFIDLENREGGGFRIALHFPERRSIAGV